jgi:hypothetical protein
MAKLYAPLSECSRDRGGFCSPPPPTVDAVRSQGAHSRPPLLPVKGTGGSCGRELCPEPRSIRAGSPAALDVAARHAARHSRQYCCAKAESAQAKREVADHVFRNFQPQCEDQGKLKESRPMLSPSHPIRQPLSQHGRYCRGPKRPNCARCSQLGIGSITSSAFRQTTTKVGA